jgi:DNA mismatch repair protein MutS2
MVQFDSANVRVSIDKLKKASKSAIKSDKESIRQYAYNNIINDMNAKMENFRLTIDVRGKRAEEALTLVQRYIDEAILLNMSEVNILHGKGNGVLRDLIRQYLRGINEVHSIADEELERGGNGITVVSFR